jgi:hypothetical protein
VEAGMRELIADEEARWAALEARRPSPITYIRRDGDLGLLDREEMKTRRPDLRGLICINEIRP